MPGQAGVPNPRRREGGRPMSATTLAPIRKTEFYPRRTRSGLTRPECWAAVTLDGLWDLHRLEDVGTPWEATYVPTGEAVWFPSLPKAQRGIADGSAMARIKAARKKVA